jgi:2-polyprenyl-3-methyl-5-hydroxy-6-metoxy-1,4-benzoquinol methylase
MVDNAEVLQSYFDEAAKYDEPTGKGRFWRALMHADRLVDEIERCKVPSGKLLEIGSGWGEFLACASYRGWEAVGIEAADRRVTWARALLRVDARCGMAPEDLPTGPFDVVAMWELIEHVTDPNLLLTYVRKRLTPGGVLALSTPCLDHPYHMAQAEKDDMWGVPSHFIYFDRRSLRTALATHGFRIERQFMSTRYFGSTCTLARLID